MVPRKVKDDTILTVNVTETQRKIFFGLSGGVLIIFGIPIAIVLFFFYAKILYLLVGFTLGVDGTSNPVPFLGAALGLIGTVIALVALVIVVIDN